MVNVGIYTIHGCYGIHICVYKSQAGHETWPNGVSTFETTEESRKMESTIKVTVMYMKYFV